MTFHEDIGKSNAAIAPGDTGDTAGAGGATDAHMPLGGRKISGMPRRARIVSGGMAGLLMAATALLHSVTQAQAAYTAKDVHLRAGPARDYPVVAVLPASAAITVQGCLGDFTWCDVTYGNDRGWVYAANIRYPYQNSSVSVLDNGPRLGIGVIGFALGAYWGDYYLGRPWYSRRDQFSNHPVTHGRFNRGPSVRVPPGRPFPGQEDRGARRFPGPPPGAGFARRNPGAPHAGNPGGHRAQSPVGRPAGQQRAPQAPGAGHGGGQPHGQGSENRPGRGR